MLNSKRAAKSASGTAVWRKRAKTSDRKNHGRRRNLSRAHCACRRSTADTPARSPRCASISANSDLSVIACGWNWPGSSRCRTSQALRKCRRSARRCARNSKGSRDAFAPADAARVKDDRAHDESRRQGGRVLAEGAIRRQSGCRASGGVHPFRLHVRGYQQSRACAGTCGGAARRCAAGVAGHRCHAARARPRACGAADAVAHARPTGHADHARQGDCQRLCARRAADRRDRAGADQGQGERRGGQLQRAPALPIPTSTGNACPPGSSRGSDWNSIPTRHRSSRTITWRNSSMPSRAPTRSSSTSTATSGAMSPSATSGRE